MTAGIPGPGEQRDGGDRASLHLKHADAVLCDLDGVLTDTASLHMEAWTEVFNHLFELVGAALERKPAPFTSDDYAGLVDGKPRLDAVRSVLASRGITLAQGSPGDGPGTGTMRAVAAAKDARFAALLAGAGPRPFPGSVRFLRRLRTAGVATAVVSASRHCADVLTAAGLDSLIDARVDGRAAAAMRLPGKPDPAAYLEAAARLGVEPGRAAVVEDALAGVLAGRRGGFRLVVGVARHGNAADLSAAGAHLVVSDLDELDLIGPGRGGDAGDAVHARQRLRCHPRRALLGERRRRALPWHLPGRGV